MVLGSEQKKQGTLAVPGGLDAFNMLISDLKGYNTHVIFLMKAVMAINAVWCSLTLLVFV